MSPTQMLPNRASQREFRTSAGANAEEDVESEAAAVAALQESARRSSFAGLFTPHISISSMSISDVQSSSFFGIGMSNFMILFRFGTARCSMFIHKTRTES